jgi:hypothetical protein
MSAHCNAICSPSRSPLELLIVFPSALAILLLGLVAGSVALILVWAPFSTRRQLERFAEPDIRPFSTLLRWVIRRLRTSETPD